MNDTSKVGIKQQIQAATSESQIIGLLNTIRGYRLAHPSTIRKCEREATKRIEFLRAQNETPKRKK